MQVAALELPDDIVQPAVKLRAVSRRGERILATAVCLALAAVSVWLRLWKLGNLPGINGDEAWSGVRALQVLAGESITWRTPTGNPINVFYFGPLVALHALFAPSFVLLRSVAAASGLVALAVNFLLARRVFGQATAIVSTVFLAVLPINLAYGRFGWDASQSLLATTLVIYFALMVVHEPQRPTRWLVACVAAFAAAILVHPTNVFVAPFVVVALGFGRRDAIRQFTIDVAASIRPWMLYCFGVLGFLAGALSRNWILNLMGRVPGPADAAIFLRDLARLFSGTTVYRFISGSVTSEAIDWTDVASWCLLIIAVYGFVRSLKESRRVEDRCLAVAAALTLIGFYLVAGPRALAPHFERYGICLIAPLGAVLSRGVLWWIGSPPARRVASFTAAAVATALLAGFYVQYFLHFENTGGRSHRTFQTASVEPKLQAWQIMDQHTPDGEPLSIVTEEWWNYWPLRYLAAARPSVSVCAWNELSPQVRDSIRRGQRSVWLVEFSGSPSHLAARRWLTSQNKTFEEFTIDDYAGKPAISIISAVKASFGNY